MRKSIISLFIILNFVAVHAGKLKGKISKPGDTGMISVSLNGNGGTAMSSGVSNAISFNPNAGIEVSWGNFGLGLDASTFTSMPDFDFNAYAAPLKSLDFLTVAGSNSNWKSTSITFGPSYTLKIVKPIPSIGIVVKHNRTLASVAVSVKGGITMNEAPNFSVVNNVSRTYIASYSSPADYNLNAFTIKPSVVFSYFLTENLAVSANVQYAMQTGQTAFRSAHKELTNISIAPPISPDQFTKNISTAPIINTSTVGPDKYFSFGVGLTYCFGKKGWDGSIKGNKKGINENGLKKNEPEYTMTDAEVKSIAETLVNMRKGWDGSIKGNIAEKKGITENGLKKNEAKSENINLYLTSTAQTLVNLARKGWDGTVKGGNIIDYVTNEADVKSVTETLVNIRKGWDGSIKGNKTEYVPDEAEVNYIAETIVNLRKGWDGSIKGNLRGRTYTGGRKNEEKGINENGLTTNETVKTSIEEKRVIWGLGGNAEKSGINGINNNMPNRISMNLTVGKQTQGATFGEKVNAGRINVSLVEGGCIILFPDNGFRVNTKEKTMTVLSKTAHTSFGEKVQQGLHAAGGALASGASLLGGALPGGAIISAAVSSVGNLAGGAGGGAAAASYAKTTIKKKIWDSGKDDDCDGLKNLPDGEYELEFVIEEKTSTKSKKEQTQVIIEFSSISNVLKTKHDTAKNSVGNIR